MTIQEKLDKIRDLSIWYAHSDWWHHKQYALVEICKIIESEKYLEEHFPDLDYWIPD